MVRLLTSVVCAGLITISISAASPFKGQAPKTDKALEVYMKEELQKHVKDHRVRLAIDDGKIFGIMIEGEIKDGDYDAFVELVKERKGTVVDVYLYSPGGSALEAMKIGRLVRKLKMHTSVPLISPTNPRCGPALPAFAENCTCESACFLIHAAGIERSGAVLGLHRVYVAHDVLRNLSSAEAVRASVDIKKTLTSYLSEMGVPTAYIERVLATPSGKIEFLTAKEVERDFSGYIPEYQEWITAKCGDALRLFNQQDVILKASKFKDSAKTIGDLRAMDKDFDLVSAKIDEAFECTYNIGRSLAAEAFEQNFR